MEGGLSSGSTGAAYSPGNELLRQGDFGAILAQLFAAMQARQGAPSPNMAMPFAQPRPQLSPEQIEALARQEAETQRGAIQAYSPMEQARARRYMKDPVGAAISEQNAEMATHSGIDWFKRVNQIPDLTPAARFAVQGPSAANQWARLGAYEGIDPKEVERLTVNRRFPS
jgi:hypothetical protein